MNKLKSYLLPMFVILFGANTACTAEFSKGERQDLRLIAEERDWTMKEAKAQSQVTARLGVIAENLAAKYPDVYVGAALSKEPGGTPSIYLKGYPTNAIYEDLSGEDLTIVSGQPFSAVELQERVELVSGMLADQGYTDFMTSFDMRNKGNIDAVVTRKKRDGVASTQSDLETAESITSQLPESFIDLVSITFQEDPVGSDDSAFDGMKHFL